MSPNQNGAVNECDNYNFFQMDFIEYSVETTFIILPLFGIFILRFAYCHLNPYSTVGLAIIP